MPGADGTITDPIGGQVLDSEVVSGRAGEILRTKTAVGLVDKDGGDAWTKYSFDPAATFTQQSIKVGPGVLAGLNILNQSGASVYVQLFDLLTSSVTPGATVPDMEFLVLTTINDRIWFPPPGIGFTVGMVIFCSTAKGGATGSATGLRVEAIYA